jgi:trimethylamine--corrinoid protein Co-methyltransferase
MDYAKLIMDAEMIRMVQTAIKGVTISDETLAFDVIHEVGPGGAYITHDHSFNSMQNQSRTELFDRRTRDNWMEKTGGEAMRERAYEAAINILENHKPCPLPEGAAEILRAMVIEFDKEQGLKK